MALPKVYRVVQDSLGNVVPQVLCSVLNEGTGVLATLWQDDAATIPLSNPMTSDATYGSFGFYVAPGHYDFTFTKPGYTFQPQMDVQVPQDDLTLGTLAQQDASAVAITGGSATGLTNLDVVGHVDVGNIDNGSCRMALEFSKGGGQHGLLLHGTAADTGAYHVIFLNSGGSVVGSISTTVSATAYNTSSDVRLKHAITPLTGALAVVRALKPVAFKWRADDSAGHGFLAQEVAQVVDGVVTGDQDAMHPDGTMNPQQIDYSKLVVWLVGCCQELAQQVQALTGRLDATGG